MTSRTPYRPHPRRLRGALAAPLLAGLVLAACSTSTTVDTDDLVNLIEDDLATELGVPITEGECPEVTDPAVGDTIVCSGTVDGQTARFEVIFTDVDDLTATVVNADAILVRSQLDALIMEQITIGDAPPATIECFDSEYYVALPGTVIECPVTGADGSERIVRVDVIDNTGAVNLTLVE